jgi:hypothetical protein
VDGPEPSYQFEHQGQTVTMTHLWGEPVKSMNVYASLVNYESGTITFNTTILSPSGRVLGGPGLADPVHKFHPFLEMIFPSYKRRFIYLHGRWYEIYEINTNHNPKATMLGSGGPAYQSLTFAHKQAVDPVLPEYTFLGLCTTTLLKHLEIIESDP